MSKHALGDVYFLVRQDSTLEHVVFWFVRKVLIDAKVLTLIDHEMQLKSPLVSQTRIEVNDGRNN